MITRRQAILLPVVAAAAMTPPVKVEANEWKVLIGFQTRMPVDYLDVEVYEPFRVCRRRAYRDGEYDRDHNRHLDRLDAIWEGQVSPEVRPTLHYSWPARNVDKSDPLPQHGIYVMAAGYTAAEFEHVIRQELQASMEPGQNTRYFLRWNTPYMTF